MRTLDEALAELERWGRAGTVTARGGMTPYQALVHCAQSIEYAVRGYPAASQRSALFRATVGRAVAALFLGRGRMRHDRDAFIPGAPDIAAAGGSFADGVARLRAAVAELRASSAAGTALAPHFAYGRLDGERYERLQAMHIANHVELFAVTS